MSRPRTDALYLGFQTPDPVGNVEPDAARIAGQRFNGGCQRIEFRTGAVRPRGDHGRLDESTNAIERQGTRELLADSIGYGAQTYAMLLFQVVQPFDELPAQFFRQRGEGSLPGKSESSLTFARQGTVSQKERLEPPGLAIVGGFETQKVEEQMEIFAVVRLGRGGVVVLVLLVIFDNRLQNTRHPADDVAAAQLAAQVAQKVRAAVAASSLSCKASR